MKLLNRSALSVRPTQPFVDWINALEPTMGDDDLTLDDVERESTIYLIPEMDTPEALETLCVIATWKFSRLNYALGKRMSASGQIRSIGRCFKNLCASSIAI